MRDGDIVSAQRHASKSAMISACVRVSGENVAIANLAAPVSEPLPLLQDVFFFVWGGKAAMEGYAGDACRTVVAQVAFLLGAQP